MRNHVSIREVPADTELALHLLEEGKVEIHRLIKRAVERSHRRRGPPQRERVPALNKINFGGLYSRPACFGKTCFHTSSVLPRILPANCPASSVVSLPRCSGTCCV